MGPKKTANVLEIRKMVPMHVAEVFLIEQQSARAQSNDYNKGVAPCSQNQLFRYAKSTKLYAPIIVQHYGRVVGYMVFDELEYEVLHLARDEEAKGSGIGTYLLDCVKKERKEKPITIKVRETNETALAFLMNERNGFQFDGFLRDFYGSEGAVKLRFGHLAGMPANRIKLFGPS